MSSFKSSGNVVAAAGILPFLIIQGVAGKVVRVKRIKLTGLTLTAAAYLRALISKYSTAQTGGTSTAPAKVKVDSVDADTAGATVLQYTVAPTAGTLVGEVAEELVTGQATTVSAAALPAKVVFDFPEPIVLRGTAENIGARFGAAPASAVTLSYEIEWTEDGN